MLPDLAAQRLFFVLEQRNIDTWLYFVEIFSLLAVFSFFSKDVSFSDRIYNRLTYFDEE